jgi:hypothetical protein
MKRMHVHVSVEDLKQSVRSYSTLFAAEPSVLENDYAKWMLEDPRVNFAISKRSDKVGIEHLGIQVEDESELNEVFARLSRAEQPILEEKATTCCYAKSDKQWIADPQGVAWETFLTHGTSTVYGHAGAVDRLGELAGASDAPCCRPSAGQLAALVKPAPPIEAGPSCGCGTKA